MFQNTKKLFLLVQWAVAKVNKKWWMKNPEAVTRRFSQWCNLTLIQRFWATNVCLQAFGHPTGRATCWKANFENYSIFFDTMVSILINIIQPEQYYLIILLIGLKAATLLKKTLTQIFSCEISRNNLFYRTHPGGCFWIKFCKY